jgi:hypothetical protein
MDYSSKEFTDEGISEGYTPFAVFAVVGAIWIMAGQGAPVQIPRLFEVHLLLETRHAGQNRREICRGFSVGQIEDLMVQALQEYEASDRVKTQLSDLFREFFAGPCFALKFLRFPDLNGSGIVGRAAGNERTDRNAVHRKIDFSEPVNVLGVVPLRFEFRDSQRSCRCVENRSWSENLLQLFDAGTSTERDDLLRNGLPVLGSPTGVISWMFRRLGDQGVGEEWLEAG